METFVYEDTPLADYLEGSGEGAEEWISQEVERPSQSPAETPTLNFAPRGRPKFQDRIRNKLPAPLQLDTLKKRETIAKLQGACSAAVSARIGKSDNEHFLEQFGYIIVASQLLNEQPAPSYNTVSESLANTKHGEDLSLPRTTSFDIQGAVITAGASFIIVWLLHWSRSRHGNGWDLRRILVSVLFLSAIGIAFYSLTRRQWLKYLRRQAVDVGTILIGNAQTFDAAAAASVVLIQEVELVSRGYRLSTPLPPVTRLEEQTQTRRCLRLRKILSDSLSEMLRHYLDAKRTLRPLTDTTNLEKYYDIYGFTPEELRDAELTLVDSDNEERSSLRSLRILFNKVYSARKGTLCCLLALPADGGGSDITKWNTAVEVMQMLATTSGSCIRKITDILNEQDRETVPQSPRATLSPGKEQYRARLRRLNSLSQGIRSLHAKMHLIREESGSSIEGTSENANATLMTLYESIGADLRGLLQEWEAGKSSLLASLESPTRFSRPPSMLKSPSSTTSDSLDGATAVEGTDGSPTAALRALTGEDDNLTSPDCNMDDNEVFEAIAIPRKRNSMTREERIARMKEDRAKHAAARERMDANTNMLKELETVIKLRPQGPTGQRVTSL